jgi:NAD(P)-dependent dehydrogenase (short-subunit alcohol dehydrogenase family)
MNVAIMGGTAGMGRAIARRLAGRKSRIALFGWPAEDVERSAEDLRQRGAESVTAIPCNLLDPTGFASAFDAAEAGLGAPPQLVVVTAALFGTQEQLEADTDLAVRLCTANFANTVGFCEHARKRMLAAGGGTLVVFSSVAGDRGRKPVAIYGAGKAGLSHYLESLDHKFRSQGLVTITVKPGFVKTGMTAGLKPPPFAGEPDDVADRVIRAIDRGTPVVYAPWIWRWIMVVIRMIPRFAMRRIGF